MSSLSDTNSEVSETTRGAPHESSQNAQENTRTRRFAPNMDSYSMGRDRLWTPRDTFGHASAAAAAATTTSSSSATRPMPSGQTEAARFGTAPFAVSDMSVEARRQSIMAMDRKRRLTGSTYDSGNRRRNPTSTFGERDEILYNRNMNSTTPGSRSPGAYQRHRYGPASSTEVIDLTNSPPQAAASLLDPTLTRRSSGSTSGIYMVPRWQPDSDVTECPICKRAFTFLFRRHHCRKCGRVVCNDCSPHRITIPRQFIVNPPGPSINISSGGRDTVDLTGDDDDEEDNEDDEARNSALISSSRQYRQIQSSGIGGGEKVRLCNPCVPDPQPEPEPNFTPPTQSPFQGRNRRDDLLTLSDALRSSRHDFSNSGPIEPFPGFVPQLAFPFNAQASRMRPLPLPPQHRTEEEISPLHPRAFPYSSHDQYRHRGHMSVENPQTLQHRHSSSESSRIQSQSNRPRVRSMLDDSYMPRMFTGHVSSTRPRLSEEDICPICRGVLPSKGPGDDETARENHIMECISARDPSNQSSSNRGQGMLHSPPRGPMHMLPFIATEKDCVSENGNIPECSICMVEYDVGDELARLECLCKFHKECISEWFMRKQECPVHKVS